MIFKLYSHSFQHIIHHKFWLRDYSLYHYFVLILHITIKSSSSFSWLRSYWFNIKLIYSTLRVLCTFSWLAWHRFDIFLINYTLREQFFSNVNITNCCSETFRVERRCSDQIWWGRLWDCFILLQSGIHQFIRHDIDVLHWSAFSDLCYLRQLEMGRSLKDIFFNLDEVLVLVFLNFFFVVFNCFQHI